jgi:hypothetical protein
MINVLTLAGVAACSPYSCLRACWLQVTEAQQQWWTFKADNFDSVLLFKVGKFYEVRPEACSCGNTQARL